MVQDQFNWNISGYTVCFWSQYGGKFSGKVVHFSNNFCRASDRKMRKVLLVVSVRALFPTPPPLPPPVTPNPLPLENGYRKDIMNYPDLPHCFFYLHRSMKTEHENQFENGTHTFYGIAVEMCQLFMGGNKCD